MELLNINLSSISFATNAGNSFKELFEDLELTDVTLVCSDDQQIQAHKVILGSSSPVFKNIFKTSNLTPTIMYMRGVNSSEMKSIMNFIYLGQAEIQQSSLDDFLSLARDLRVKGLTQYEDSENMASFVHKDVEDGNKLDGEKRNPGQNGKKEQDENDTEHVLDENRQEIQHYTTDEPNASQTNEEHQKFLINSKDRDYPKQKQKQDLTIKDYYALSGRDFYDLKPDENGKFSCTDCKYVNKKRIDLAKHSLNKHVNMKIQCEDCSNEFTGIQSLQYHKKIIHEGRYFPCDICPYKGTTKNNLKTHVMKYHEA